MGLIPEDKIAEVRERADIVQVIGQHVALRRAGSANWKGLCPFHDERSPSFNVNTVRQIYHCFGCQASGDVIRFLMEFEKRDFLEVVRDLAGRAGVTLPEPSRSPAAERAAAAQKSERELLLRVNELASTFFRDELVGPRGEAARAYLASRSIGQPILERFQLGYAPARWDGLQAFLTRNRVPLALAEKVGLVGVTETGKRYDFFRDRVMLPVIGRSGETVAFGSRLLDPEAKERKYVNSPDSVLYHKKDHLYGLHAARDAMRKSGLAVLVEGNFDVIALHQAGIEEAVAPMGTALGAEQVALLRRFARTLVLLFDGDEAGRKATRAAIELVARAGVDARVVLLPDGSDPDDFVRSRGVEALRALMAKAAPAIEHRLDELASETGGTVPGRLRALELAKPLLLAIEDPTARTLYVSHFARRLGVAEAVVERALRGAGPSLGRMQPATGTIPVENRTVEAKRARKAPAHEVKLLALLLAKPSLAGQALQFDAGSYFSDADLLRLYEALQESIGSGAALHAQALLERAPEDLRGVLAGAFTLEELATERALDDCLMQMRERRLSDEVATMSKRVSAAETDPQLLAKLTELARARGGKRYGRKKGDVG